MNRDVKALEEVVSAAATVYKYVSRNSDMVSPGLADNAYNVWDALEKLLTEKEEAADA